MRAIWFVGGDVRELTSGDNPEQALFSCALASARLRTAVAAYEWKRAGCENIFRDPDESEQSVDWEGIDVCIVPKFFHDYSLNAWLNACQEAKNKQCKLILDICDYPYEKTPEVRGFYSEVLKISDAVVVNSARMAELMTPHCITSPQVIEDAILGVARKPNFSPPKKLGLLWFGHPSNLDYLVSSIEPLARFATRRHCTLTILTQNGQGVHQFVQEINSHFAPYLEARFVIWSLDSMRVALRKCDLVLIPGAPSDPRKSGVSANRLAEAIHAGRLAVATPLHSYTPFAEAAWLGDNLVEGIEWALANRGEVLRRIRLGQALVAEKFAPDKIGRQWIELFERTISSRD